MECFVAPSDIYWGFTGKLSTLIHFPLESGCEDYSFFRTKQQTLSMVLIPSLLTQFECCNWMHPLMSLIPCLLVSLQGIYAQLEPFLIILNFSLLLESNLINYGARLGTDRLNVSLKTESLFFQSSSGIWIWASPPLDNITLNPANKKTDYSLSDFQTGIGATAHATLDTEHLISCT